MGSPASPKLTEAQVGYLRRLATGERIYFSRDDEVAWLSGGRHDYIRDPDIWALRDAGFLVRKDDGDTECGRGPLDWDEASEAGRAYLATLDRERDDAMTTHPDSDRRE